MSDDQTHLSPGAPPDSKPTQSRTSTSGWLSSSGSIDHGRFAPGTLFEERYRIVGLLGRGGMGEVYRADDLRLGQPVALKFLPPTLHRDPVRLAQFHNEVRTARQVSHPNVCRMYDIGEVPSTSSGQGDLYLTMEYVDGEDLSSLIRRIGRLPEDKALEIARQICAGLAAAHERGVLHRDLKPANIMLDGTGKVRLMDFSLAAVGEVTDIRAGTPAYMAPEQLDGREVTIKSDIYALGLVLYELFTGRRAFTATTLAALVEQHASGTITAPSAIMKAIDPAIERAILRCLEVDPARRPSSALAVSASLPGGDPLAAALAAGETPSPELVAAAGGEDAALSPRASRLWVALVVVLLVAVTALADRVSLLPRIPLSKPAAVLEDRAEEIRQALGYNEPVADHASGFAIDYSYRNWGTRNDPGAAHWKDLASGRTAPLRLWYRTSPRTMVPTNPIGSLSQNDPPLLVTNMTLLQVDTKGRLVSFEAMPPEVEPLPLAIPSSVDWRAVFAAAGLDLATFVDVTPTRTPRTHSDDRRAWRGLLPETQITVVVEAASYRGRPVFFDIVKPWTTADRDPAGDSGDDTNPVQTIIILLLLIASAALARQNLRSGRADCRGAFRLACAMFFVYMTIWLLSPHVPLIDAEKTRFFAGIGIALFIAAAMYLIYLALEPFVRRSWPTTLVGWSRALAGRLRDPIIGRDALMGAAAGLVLTLWDRLDVFVPGWLGWPEPFPQLPQVDALFGTRMLAIVLVGSLNNSLQNALLTFLEFSVFREGLRRAAGWVRRSWTPSDIVTALVALLLVTVIAGVDTPTTPRHLWLPMVYRALTFIVAVFVMLRFGLLASLVMYLVNSMTVRVPLTFDPGRLYASQGWFALALVASLAITGAWMARDGRSRGVSARSPGIL